MRISFVFLFAFILLSLFPQKALADACAGHSEQLLSCSQSCSTNGQPLYVGIWEEWNCPEEYCNPHPTIPGRIVCSCPRSEAETLCSYERAYDDSGCQQATNRGCGTWCSQNGSGSCTPGAQGCQCASDQICVSSEQGSPSVFCSGGGRSNHGSCVNYSCGWHCSNNQCVERSASVWDGGYGVEQYAQCQAACAAPGCGASGQACCSGSSCNSGLSCSGGICGTPGCGASGQACCSGSSCNSGLSCSGGICQSNPPPSPPPSCGGRDQNCCSGNSCDSGLVCRGGSCQPDSCGAQGERCCGGDRCDAGYNCVGGFCGNGPACNATCNPNAQNCPAGYTCFNDQGYKCRLTACPANSNCACDPPQNAACSVYASPNPLVMTGVGTQQTITANVNVAYGAVKAVEFHTSNGGIILPTPDISYGPVTFQVPATATGAGNTGIGVYVWMEAPGIDGYHVRCSTNIDVQVLNIPGWWQAVDSDVFAAGDLRSQIPTSCSGASCTPQLILPGAGGYSGVPAYSGSTHYGSGTVSSSGWNANTTYTGRRYDYDWYRSLAATDTEVVNCPSGCNLNSSDINAKAGDDKVNIVVYEGNVTLTNNVNMNSKKVAIFVNGNLTVNDRIQLNDGSGFFAAFVKGNIVINPSVTHPTQPSVEALFVSDGSFSTGAGSSRYYHRGSVVAWGGVSLQRDLAGGNQQNPAERFEYAPDLILSFPQQLFRDGVVWREIAP